MTSPSNDSDAGPPSVNALVLLCVLNHTALTGGRVAVSLQALALGASTIAMGLVLAFFALLPTLCSPWLGRWVDRVGSRRPALLGMACAGAALVLAAFTEGLVGLAVAGLLLGGGYTTSLLALQSLLGDRPSPQRAAAFSAFAFGTAISAGLGPLLAGHLIHAGGARLAFGVLAGLPVVAAVVAGWNRHRLLGRATAKTAGIERPAVRPRLLRDAPLRRVFMADFAMAVAWNANGFLLPIHATAQGWSAADVGNLGGAFGVAVLVVRALPSRWYQRVGEWPTIRAALWTAAAVFAVLPCATGLASAFALQFALGLGLGGALPSVLSLLHAHSPAGRLAEVLGLRVSALNASYLAWPVALGGLGAVVGLPAVMCGLGGGLGLAGWRLRRGAGARRLPSVNAD